ncbi:MAG: urea carboxylase-associated family protein [Alphaproteobacteria bacterium]|nr:urea carboxylase-associated family protein [Alphaproteobacteria bacterium]
MPNRITIPARKGKAAHVNRGQHVKIVNTHGQQVVDTWAFNRADIHEFMSMPHCHTRLSALFCRVGQSMYTNRHRAILTLVEDTSGNIHDTLIAACDRYRYEVLGCKDYHDNCTDNLAASMRALGLDVSTTPPPWNIFMNIPVLDKGVVGWLPPVSTPGSYVLLRAEMDLTVAFSACPQDMIPINGAGLAPTEAHFEII